MHSQLAAPAFVNWPQINNWLPLQATQQGHLTKGSPPPDIMNFKIINVLEHCVVPPPQSCEYIALSYVSGQPSLSFESKLANIESLKTPGALLKQYLPRTLSDVMEACKRLGYQYLWVDALCIIQDDFENKEEQISQMDKIYRGAALCIIAAAGLDSNHGLPGVTCQRRWAQSIEHANDMNLHARLGEAEFCVIADKWAARGWTYQEFCLSQRLFYFTEFGAFYIDRTPEALNTGDPCFLTDQPACNDDSATGHLYMDSDSSTTLRAYTMRNLSFSEDILKAFLGILNHKFPEGHAYGLPYGIFDQCILWSCPDFMSTARTTSDQNVFPSWSWTSACGPIFLSQGKDYSVAFWATSTPPSNGSGDLTFMIPGNSAQWEMFRWPETFDTCLFAWALGCTPGKPPADLYNDALDLLQTETVMKRWNSYADCWMGAFGPFVTNPPFSRDEIIAAQTPGCLLVYTQEAVLGIELTQEVDIEVPGRRMIKIKDDNGVCIGAAFLSDHQINHCTVNGRKAVRFIALSVCHANEPLSSVPWKEDRTKVDTDFYNRHNSGQNLDDPTTSNRNDTKYSRPQHPKDIHFWKAGGLPAELAVMSVMVIEPTHPGDDQRVRRVGIGQIFLRKWGEAKRQFKMFILE
jgi:hypothetical protein